MAQRKSAEAALPQWLQTDRKRHAKRRKQRGLIYYKLKPAPVVALAEDALYTDKMLRAMRESRTWGDFRKAVPEEYDRIFEDEKLDGEPLPADTEPFSRIPIDGGDGDYPMWLQHEALHWLPVVAITECVKIEHSMVSGSFATIPEENILRLVEILTAEGYTVEHRPDLLFREE